MVPSCHDHQNTVIKNSITGRKFDVVLSNYSNITVPVHTQFRFLFFFFSLNLAVDRSMQSSGIIMRKIPKSNATDSHRANSFGGKD